MIFTKYIAKIVREFEYFIANKNSYEIIQKDYRRNFDINSTKDSFKIKCLEDNLTILNKEFIKVIMEQMNFRVEQNNEN